MAKARGSVKNELINLDLRKWVISTIFKEFRDSKFWLRNFYSSLLCSTSEWKTKKQWLDQDDLIIKEGEAAFPFWFFDKNTKAMKVYKMYNKSQTSENPDDRYFDKYQRNDEIGNDDYAFATRER